LRWGEGRMERHEASLALQNAIRKHENDEQDIIKTWEQIFKVKFGYKFEIESIDDIAEAHDYFMNDGPFGYMSDPNTETGLLLRTIRKIL
jgi:hypothetical protein